MNHYVPDFEIEDQDYAVIPLSSSKRTSMPDGDIMEILWQNGQIVMQSQNHRCNRKPPSHTNEAVIPAADGGARTYQLQEGEQQSQQLFMQEDEMASWLHYPVVVDPPHLDHAFCDDLLYSFPAPVGESKTAHPDARTSEFHQPSTVAASDSKPPMPPTRRTELAGSKIQNFAHFSRHNARAHEPGPSSSKAVVRESSTVVDSSDTPAVGPNSGASVILRRAAEQTEGDVGGGRVSSGRGVRDMVTCDMTVMSSPGGSSGSAEPVQRPTAEDRKRKGRKLEESECESGDILLESVDAKKQVRGSTSTKRSRAAEVHNLSERRRRDRINEKMKALQELIPRCNKSDKASMLDEAIEYLKSLQLQVQMMSMGCGMVPMMFPGIQHYMPPVGMGAGIGMGMEMGMGMRRPLMPFPNLLAGSTFAQPAAAAHLVPSFPMRAYQMQHVPPPESSRMEAAIQADHMPTSAGMPNHSQSSRVPNFTDPYLQYLGPHSHPHQIPLQLMRDKVLSQASASKGPENPENQPSAP